MSDTKPTALIFGGLNTYSRALAAHLVPLQGEALVSHVRIVDKYSVKPPTTYIGAEFPKILDKPEVDYHQANVTVASTIASMFDPPEGVAGYDYVFDFTGEIRPDRPEKIHIQWTFNVARMIAIEAAKRKVKSYVRLQLPFYETSSKSSATHDEKEDCKPEGSIGTWWHETLRMLAAMEDLNVVVLRIGHAYGPYVNFGIVPTVITVAAVYGYLKKPMKSLWGPGKHGSNTVHTDDVSAAMWACAEWMAPLGRKAADEKAGEQIPFHNDKSKVSEVEGMVSDKDNVTLPLFNLVDDSDSTFASAGSTITEVFGTTFEFFNFFENTVLKMVDVVEDINEHHVGGWTDMIQKSNPPIPNTPLSAYMDAYQLEKHVVAFNNAKIKQVLGHTLRKPKFEHDAIRDVVDKWKEEGSWPILE
ncbi:hypothetical protein BD626DRAFT_550238 [Schizophyllum amplum]|uniref:NAD-dependent epimerase/dehydratase domain-containing protein n=1 Tax=Schizophyllum amplum TaxID=97359 RepID=A0A550C3K4_9AGAR|nr:hypothetical protein BD626DRAFT_550238 [Auriculariopsis ampla]